MIFVNIEVAIFCVSIQSDPLSTGITYWLANRTLGKDFNRPVFQAVANLIKNRFALLLT
jgi:hypothetical protein